MTIEAYAKVNFTLDVYGVRTDGYHALRSVVMPISLSDTITLTPANEISSNTGYDDDLCLKAARALDPTRGVQISVVKRIPAGGGLGGGSADAAAVLRALNKLWGLNMPLSELAEFGAQIGSDVPALVLGGPVLMEGRGEKVQSLQSPTLNLVVVNPGVHCSTAEVYAACDARSQAQVSPTDCMIDALKGGDLARIATATSNDLQPAAVKLHPEIADALVSLRTAGALGVTMTGSGSCVFGFAPDAKTAERISSELNFKGFQSWFVTTKEI